jgi:hypothetical protein
MTQELRKVFEKFLSDFKATYDQRFYRIIKDLKAVKGQLYKPSDLFWQGYVEALDDMKKALRM